MYAYIHIVRLQIDAMRTCAARPMLPLPLAMVPPFRRGQLVPWKISKYIKALSEVHMIIYILSLIIYIYTVYIYIYTHFRVFEKSRSLKSCNKKDTEGSFEYFQESFKSASRSYPWARPRPREPKTPELRNKSYMNAYIM